MPHPDHQHPPAGDAAVAVAALDQAPASPPPGLPPGREVELPGRGTTWIREAAGPAGAPTVVLLHGWSVTADLNWFTSYAALAERYHVVALDHRGHGRGLRPPKGRVRLADCADDVAALLDVLGIEQAILVGYSMGGPIALLTWHRHRDRVAGLVLCSTAKHFQTGPVGDLWYRSYGWLARLAHAADGPSRALLRRMVDRRSKDGVPTDWLREELKRSDPAAVLSAMASLGRFRSNRWVGSIEVPAAVVVSTKDRTVSPLRQRALAKAIPGAERFDVEGRHDVCVTAPERFVPALLGALANVTERRRTPVG